MRRCLLLVAVLGACGPSGGTEGECTDDLRPGDLVITEVFPDFKAPPGGGGTDEGKEWFEIYNASDREVELEGLVISHGRPDDEEADTHTMEKVTIPPGEHLTLGNSIAELLPAYVDYGYSASLGDMYNSGAGQIELRCGETLVDSAQYEMIEEGFSRQLTSSQPPDYTLNDDLTQWCAGGGTEFEIGNFGTPGTDNDCLPTIVGQCNDGGTARDTVPPGPGDLIITEFMPEPSSPQPDKEWFEVRVMRDVDLNGLALDRAGDTSAADMIESPDCIAVTAGSFIVFARNTDETLNGGLPPGAVLGEFDFSLTSSADKPGDIQVLHGGVVIDAITWVDATARRSRSLDPDFVDATANDEESNFCDGVDVYGAGDFGTPGAMNPQCVAQPQPGQCDDGGTIRAVVKPTPANFVITEFLANPAGSGTDATQEWFEVQNTGATAWDLNDLVVKGNTVMSTIASAECKSIPAGGFALLAHTTATDTNGGLPEVDATFTSALAQSNGSISVLEPDGVTVIDAITWTTGIADGPSKQLDPDQATSTGNDTPANFCNGTTAYGTAGNLGTPKAPNLQCP